MRPNERAVARRKLDKRLNHLRDSDAFVRPSRGWLKAIREALGMTTTQLAERLGVVQSRAVAIEKAEIEGSITLNSLEKAAQAMDCRLVYALVPRQPLDKLVRERAERLAKKRMESTRHSMALEAQRVEAADEQEQLKRMIDRLLEKAGSDIWEDE
ncbi:MAG: mobile mystery protein A [Candidatus Thiodiazotropha endolucinida]|nr:mobile mystery protein A [Candidatus Thiodiazotropha taylori]MCG8092698.1 mobile mystery protein A [Candidatus Thiodiazotropha endolucinida]MCG8046019.1 mobile mystery protein A [Candidatus Thiodiazotropha taylori]MCG8053124.1 mobile mystery protein A [Candidatus Thiodiazotropha taylori]MCG8072791.1 mobile mystery protein A [Candidatus Thiodiazotropha taylori]